MYSNISFNCGDNYNASGQLTYDIEKDDGGIPENLALNLAIWLVGRLVVAYLVRCLYIGFESISCVCAEIFPAIFGTPSDYLIKKNSCI